MLRNRVKQRRSRNPETDLQRLKKELSNKLAKLEPVVQEYVVPELFTRCHCKRSIKLLVEDQEIYASKQILKLASPVFLSMFESDFREKSMESIELPGKTCQEVFLLLSCLYPNILEQIEDDEIEREKKLVRISSLSQEGRKAYANIERLLCGKNQVEVNNWFGTAKELKNVFSKLHVKSISTNRKTGRGTVQFDDSVNTLFAYCLDGQKSLEVILLPISDDNDVEESISHLSDEDDGANEEFWLDTWQIRQIHFTAKEKIHILLKLADEYQMEAVLRLCEEKYLHWYNQQLKHNKEIPVDKIIQLLQVAQTYSLQNLHREVSDEAVKTKLKVLFDQPGFEKLSTNTRFSICQSKLLKFGQSDGDLSKPGDDKKCTESKKNNTVLPQKVDNGAFIDGTNPYITMVIQVGSEKLYTSREVLALSSKLLKDKMEANVDKKPLDFPDHNRDDFLCLLRSIHPGFQPTVNSTNVKRLLKLADAFKLQNLLADCEDVLDADCRNIDIKPREAERTFVKNGREFTTSAGLSTAREYLSLAVQYKLPKLQASCCDAISTMKYQQLMWFLENNNSLPQDVLINIMYPRILMLENLVPEYRLKSLYSKTSEENINKKMNFISDSELFRQQTKYDVCLVVQGENLYIDEDVLTLASPFFKREIEKQNSQHRPVIVCDGKEIDEMVTLLKCIHPSVMPKVSAGKKKQIMKGVQMTLKEYPLLRSNEPTPYVHSKTKSTSWAAEVDNVDFEEVNVMDILRFVEEFEMSALSKVCEDSLIETCTEKMSTATIVDYIAKAEKYKMPRLRTACEATLAKMCGGEQSSRHRTTIDSSDLDQFCEDEQYSPFSHCSSDDSY